MARRFVALAALTSLAAIAHPETAEGQFRDRVEEAYRTIYGKDVTDAQLDSILESERWLRPLRCTVRLSV